MRGPWAALFKALLNVNFGVSALRAQFRRGERVWEPLMIAASVLVGIGVMTWLIATFARAMIQTGLEFGQPEIVLTLAHFAAAIIVLVFGLAYVMGAFYFSNDMGFLPAWPLSARQVLSAKFATILVNEYLTTMALLLPVYVTYVMYVPVGPLFIPSAILTFLLTPVIPLAIAALLVVLLMRVVSVTRRRDFFTMIGGLLLVAGVLVVQYFVQRAGSEFAGETELFELIFGQAHGLSRLAATGYPPSYWSMLALAEAGSMSGFAGMAGLAVGSLVAFGVFLAAGDRFFLSAAQSTGVERGRRIGQRALSGGVSPVRSVARVERKLFLRTPMYVLNGFVGFVIVPVLLALPEFSQDQALSALVRSGKLDPNVGLIAIWGWFAVSTGMSLIPATAFSREGQRLWIMKSLPISGREYFLGKLLGAESMILVGALPCVAALVYVLGLGLLHAVIGIVLGAITSILVAMICLAIDAMRPWLTWTDPTRAIKSNVNGIIGMAASVILVAASVWAGLLLVGRGVPPRAAMTILAALYIAAPFILWQWLGPKLDSLLHRMGD